MDQDTERRFLLLEARVVGLEKALYTRAAKKDIPLEPPVNDCTKCLDEHGQHTNVLRNPDGSLVIENNSAVRCGCVDEFNERVAAYNAALNARKAKRIRREKADARVVARATGQ